MEKVRIECLRCGDARKVTAVPQPRRDPGECPRCGYIGWAPSSALSEPVRRRIREQPLDRRATLYGS
ncbi:MAG: hypothetical protein M3188_00315 [Actinomycetota bacterium]|nr:hypothetical protein [Actinomycetota bacterium]